MNHTYILYCDPSSSEHLVLRYGDVEQNSWRETIVVQPKADTLLQLIDQFIHDQPVHQLVVVNQARSFTLLRVLIAMMNTLAFSKHLPVYSLPVALSDMTALRASLGKSQQYLKPHYSAAPNITL